MKNITETSKQKKLNNPSLVYSVIIGALLMILIVGSFFMISHSIWSGVSSAKSSFKSSFSEAESSSYSDFRNTISDIVEEKYHVSNDISINVGNIKEKSELEVLNVKDVVFIITDSSETKSKTTSWLKVEGSGFFTLDLATAEYIVDDYRKHVSIHVPSPRLKTDNITIDSCESLYFDENKLNRNNSVKGGADLAIDQLSEAQQKIQEDFMSNEDYYKLAKDSAESMLSSLIKSLNPDVPKLEVDIEFY